MEIMVVKPLYIEEVAKVVKNVEKKYCVKKFVAGVHIGVRIAKKIRHQKKFHNGSVHNWLRQETAKIHIPSSSLKTQQNRKTSRHAFHE